MASVSTTRGVPFDPAASAAARELAQRKEARQRADVGRQRVQAEARSDVPPNKAKAIYLDQVEHAYKERARDRRSS